MKITGSKTIILFAILLYTLSGWSQNKKPNFIIILADDLGYGDLGSYGHPTIRTPCLDQMARDGIRFTQFYAGAAVCTPSRAALLTARLGVRTGMYGKRSVLFPNSAAGLPSKEVTIAEVLKTQGYRTGIVGKWHLGHLPEFLPTKQGFDYYFGVPYSNDMGKIVSTRSVPQHPQASKPRPNAVPLPLLRNDKKIEEEPDQRYLTKRYTEEAIKFIQENKNEPFFLYYPSNFPHTPLYASPDFEGKSQRGIYGDVVEELDWSVGQILKTLKDLKLDENTFVLFTSDNGPWLTQRDHGGSAGLLYEGKNSTYEGGMRIPAIVQWKGKIKPGTVSTSLATMMDLFPTIAHYAGAPLSANITIDGVNIADIFEGKKQEVRDLIYYYINENLYAIRKGKWKAHFTTHASYSKDAPVVHDAPLLYNIDADPSEKYNLSQENPAVVAELKEIYQQQIKLVPSPALLDAIVPQANKK